MKDYKSVGTESELSKLNVGFRGCGPVPKAEARYKKCRGAERDGMLKPSTCKNVKSRSQNKYILGRGRLPPLLGNYQVGVKVPGFLGRNRLAHFGWRNLQRSFGVNSWRCRTCFETGDRSRDGVSGVPLGTRVAGGGIWDLVDVPVDVSVGDRRRAVAQRWRAT